MNLPPVYGINTEISFALMGLSSMDMVANK